MVGEPLNFMFSAFTVLFLLSSIICEKKILELAVTWKLLFKGKEVSSTFKAWDLMMIGPEAK